MSAFQLRRAWLALSCGHQYEGFFAEGGGFDIPCALCRRPVKLISATNLGSWEIFDMKTDTPRRPARPHVDAMLEGVCYMIVQSLRVNVTGKSFEEVLEEARVKTYDALDANCPATPPTETAEQKRLRIKDNTLRWMVIQPGTDMNTLVKTIEGCGDIPTAPETDYKAKYNDLAEGVRYLKTLAVPIPRASDGRPSGLDYNGIVYYIGLLQAPKL